MIQYYINTRPVPRAVARHYLEQANPGRSLDDISRALSLAFRKDAQAVRFLASYGVSVHQVKG